MSCSSAFTFRPLDLLIFFSDDDDRFPTKKSRFGTRAPLVLVLSAQSIVGGSAACLISEAPGPLAALNALTEGWLSVRWTLEETKIFRT